MSRPIGACTTCAAIGGVDPNQECEDQLIADVRLLNSLKAHVVPAPAGGVMPRETIHALAAVARAFLATKAQTG